MKIFFACCCLSLLWVGPAFAACDVEARTDAFGVLLKKVAAENPQKLNAINDELQSFASRVADMLTKGQDDEVCRVIDALEKKIK